MVRHHGSFAISALITGVLLSLATPWGLFRHYWVAISLALTALSVGLVILHMPTVSVMADAARDIRRWSGPPAGR